MILGFGAIGACSALVGRALGLDVIVSEPSAERLTHAAELGLRVHEPEGVPRDVARSLRTLTDGADVVIDASGAPLALEAAPDMTIRGGRAARGPPQGAAAARPGAAARPLRAVADRIARLRARPAGAPRR